NATTALWMLFITYRSAIPQLSDVFMGFATSDIIPCFDRSIQLQTRKTNIIRGLKAPGFGLVIPTPSR
ncbi:MAG: hypothetical protein ACYSSN_10725, partial [Planctomycetota bacterium]